MPRWRVDIIRKRAEHLGTVDAATEKEAIEKAAERFDIPRRWRVRGLMRYLAGYITVRFDDPRRLTAGGHAFDAITLRCGKCSMPRREWDESRGDTLARRRAVLGSSGVQIAPQRGVR